MSTHATRSLCHTPCRRCLFGLLALAATALPVMPAEAAPVLKYLGRYDFQAQDGPDHLLGVALYDEEFLVATSAVGAAMVSREAIESGTVTEHAGKYFVAPGEPSNLDGAPTNLFYRPKFFDIAVRPPYLYVTTRFDGLWILRADRDGAGWTVVEVGRHLRAREFTESVALRGRWLFLTHHADGIEVMDVSPDPEQPATVDTLEEPLVDAWGIAPTASGDVWIADGAGGVKRATFDGSTLEFVGGDTLETSPGTVFDVAVLGNFVVAAVAGNGVAVYDALSGTRLADLPLDGVCVDVEPMAARVFALACRGWVHALRLGPGGEPIPIASVPASGRTQGTTQLSTHLAQRVRAQGATLYVAAWDHLDAYRLTGFDPEQVADIRLSGQRAQFGEATSPLTFEVSNGGQGALQIDGVDCPDGLLCELGAFVLGPEEATELTVTYDGFTSNLRGRIDIRSNDPDEPVAGILAFADLPGVVDPGEAAPPFAGPSTERDYDAETFVESTIELSEFADRGETVHFAIFGTWCPACTPAVTSMVNDIQARLPTGAAFFIVDQGEPVSVLRHVLEKVYIPVEIFLDTDSLVGGQLYRQPQTGLPFSRAYNVDPTGTATDIYTSYDPAAVIDRLNDLVNP